MKDYIWAELNKFLIIIVLLVVAVIYFTQKEAPVVNVSPPDVAVNQENAPFTITSSGDNLWVLDNRTRVLKLYRLDKTNYGDPVIVEVTSRQIY